MKQKKQKQKWRNQAGCQISLIAAEAENWTCGRQHYLAAMRKFGPSADSIIWRQ
jgi:hypothetical protein